MVFGFGEGSIDLMLDKTNFTFGETMHGFVNLRLKKTKQAKQLKVMVTAVRYISRYGGGTIRIGSAGGRSSGSSTEAEYVFSTEKILDGEKEYAPPGTRYEFQIQLPPRSALPSESTQPEIGGKLGAVIGVAQRFSSVKTSIQTTWYVEAKLDIPGGRDITKEIQVTVSEISPQPGL